MTSKEKEIIGKLIGLAKAADGNADLRSFSIDSLVFEGLSVIDTNIDEQILEDISSRITLQKRKLAPSCFTCSHPCGRTADYDLSDMEKEDIPIQQGKNKVLSKIIDLAKQNKDIEKIYQGLILIGFQDCENEYLETFLN